MTWPGADPLCPGCVVFLAGDFFAVPELDDFFAVLFFAGLFLAVLDDELFFAGDFLAVDFLAVDVVVDFFAGVFFAPVFLATGLAGSPATLTAASEEAGAFFAAAFLAFWRRATEDLLGAFFTAVTAYYVSLAVL